MRKKSRHAVSESLGQTADMKPEGGGGERFAIKVKGEYPLNTERPSDRSVIAYRIAIALVRRENPRVNFCAKVGAGRQIHFLSGSDFFPFKRLAVTDNTFLQSARPESFASL